jgi:hypothetical protein
MPFHAKVKAARHRQNEEPESKEGPSHVVSPTHQCRIRSTCASEKDEREYTLDLSSRRAMRRRHAVPRGTASVRRRPRTIHSCHWHMEAFGSAHRGESPSNMRVVDLVGDADRRSRRICLGNASNPVGRVYLRQSREFLVRAGSHGGNRRQVASRELMKVAGHGRERFAG